MEPALSTPAPSIPSLAKRLEQLDGRWEIYQGELREKPPSSFGHNHAQAALVRQLIVQNSDEAFRVLCNAGHASIPGGDSYLPDTALVPAKLTEELHRDPWQFERYSDPLPFVAEVWCPLSGNYDIDAKISGYRMRGDAEIWRVDPFDNSVRIRRRQTDGSYVESIERSGLIALHTRPGVQIDIDDLFQTE